MSHIKLFGQLQKAEKQVDGTLIVSGIASSEAVDSEGETIRAAAMKAALPDYMAFGAVREMHQPIAAGVALKCEVMADGKTAIEAHIVDPVTIKKVEAGVLQGFSIGGNVTGRDSLDKTIITGLTLTEISLVDRPCNPEALVSLCKLVKSGEDEEKEKGTEDDNENEDGEDDEKSEDGEDEKEDEDEDEGKRKKKMVKLAAAHGMALSKILSLEARLHKAQTELEGLKKKAAAPKAAVRAISKGEDTGGPDLEAALQKQAMALSALSETERATALVRIIRSTR